MKFLDAFGNYVLRALVLLLGTYVLVGFLAVILVPVVAVAGTILAFLPSSWRAAFFDKIEKLAKEHEAAEKAAPAGAAAGPCVCLNGLPTTTCEIPPPPQDRDHS